METFPYADLNSSEQWLCCHKHQLVPCSLESPVNMTGMQLLTRSLIRDHSGSSLVSSQHAVNYPSITPYWVKLSKLFSFFWWCTHPDHNNPTQKNTVGHGDKNSASVKVKDIHTSPHDHKYVYVITEGNWLGLTWFIHGQPVLAILCQETGLLPWLSLALNCLTSLYFLRPCPFEGGYSLCTLDSFPDHHSISMVLESSSHGHWPALSAFTPEWSLSALILTKPCYFRQRNEVCSAASQ